MKEHEQNKFICHNCGWIPSAGMSAEELDHCRTACQASIKRTKTGMNVAEYDSRIKILSIASKPMASPPFPVDKLEELTKMMGGQGDLNR